VFRGYEVDQGESRKWRWRWWGRTDSVAADRKELTSTSLEQHHNGHCGLLLLLLLLCGRAFRQHWYAPECAPACQTMMNKFVVSCCGDCGVLWIGCHGRLCVKSAGRITILKDGSFRSFKIRLYTEFQFQIIFLQPCAAEV